MQYFLIEDRNAQYFANTLKGAHTMASCDWKKIKGAGEAKAMFRHCDEVKRLELEHSNIQIDKSRTHLNMALGEFSNGYDSICKKYDKAIAELDSIKGANKRKDRVTLIGWSVPAPEGMDEDTARDWLTDVYRLMLDKYGGRVLGGSVHFDEIHEYIDAETGKKRKSRPHLHMYAVPVVNGKLNAKQFMSRDNIVAVNKSIELLTRTSYPGYKFQTGTKAKSKKSVETLKNESAVVEVMAKAQAESVRIVAQAQALQIVTKEEAERLLTASKQQAGEIVIEAKEKVQRAFEGIQRERKEIAKERALVEKAKGELLAVYRQMETEKKYFSEAHAAYLKARLNTDLRQVEEYMKSRTVRKRDGTKETIYDGYVRDVLKPWKEHIAKNANAEDVKRHEANFQAIRRSLIGMDVIAPDEKDDDYSL